MKRDLYLSVAISAILLATLVFSEADFGHTVIDYQGTNLSPMTPDGGDWHMGGYGGGTKNLFVDYDVLSPKGNPSWRIEAYTDGDATTPKEERVGNFWRECISHRIPSDWQTNPLKTGDFIVVRMWIRTGSSTLGDIYHYPPSSVVLVWDYRINTPTAITTQSGHPYQVREHSSNNIVHSEEWGDEYACDIISPFRLKDNEPNQFVPMNTIALYPETNGWVQRTLTGRVPAFDPAIGRYRILNYDGSAWSDILPQFVAVAFNAGSYQYRDPVTNVPIQDQGTVWVADAEVYINPTIVEKRVWS